MTSIRIEGVAKSFGEVKALAGVSLSIEPGELFTLLGPSGCGKTTLLRTVAGFYRQDAGDIWLGDELINDKPAYKRDTGLVFQNYAVFPHMTVFENVAYGLRVRKLKEAEIKAKVEAALARVRLVGYGTRTPDQLSGGQQQRVGLARAMAIEPRVLLLDEPLSNLDAKLRIEMREEIRDIQKQLGITAIYVTHDQEEALVISDRIAVVAKGEILQVGEPWAIYKDPASLFVATFVGTTNLLDAEILGPAEGGAGGRAQGSIVRARVVEREILLPAPAVAFKGTKLKLAFRPEDAFAVKSGGAVDSEGTAGSEEARGVIALEGKVLHASFLGSAATLGIDLGGGASAIVERHRPGAGDVLKIGETASFSLGLDAILLFDPETGERIRYEGGRA
jgi:iron(III) transport system ATP-binding protein